MSAGRHSFKRTDAARLIGAAKAAGCKIRAVVLRDGALRVEIEHDSAPAEADSSKNPLDRVLVEPANVQD